MPAPADEPLAKAWINLYAADKAWLFRRYGNGWTEKVRRLVREHRRESEAGQGAPVKLNIGGQSGE